MLHTATRHTHTRAQCWPLYQQNQPRQSVIGVQFHATTAATVLTGRRRAVRNWTRRTISTSFLCRKLHLFLGKSTETAATRAALFTPHTHPFNGPFSGTTQVSRYQKGKTNLDFTEARHSEWQWHQLGHMQVCTSLQTDNHASTPPLNFLQAGCPSCWSDWFYLFGTSSPG